MLGVGVGIHPLGVCVCVVKVRGHENLTMIAPYEKKLSFLGLGTSIGTGGSILTADIIVVRTYDELTVGALYITRRREGFCLLSVALGWRRHGGPGGVLKVAWHPHIGG